MEGTALITAVFILATIWFFPVGTIAAIIAYIVFVVSQWVSIQYARGEGRMGWTNAKKTALQYAFNNAGIDEPRPTFEEFLSNAYGITEPFSLTPQQIKDYYDEYLKAESANARKYAVSGFSKFIADEISGNGYWKKNVFGEIHPTHTSSTKITQGYGWTDDGKNTYCNFPYYCGLKDGKTDYRAKNADGTYVYDNWVEAELIGSISYGIDVYGAGDVLFGGASCDDSLDLPFPFSLIWEIICEMLMSILDSISNAFPMGIKFLDDDVPAQTTDNPILVRVTRYRRDNDLGLWKFRYGKDIYGGVSARAASHAFPENSDVDIKPAEDLKTDLHLFETELTYAY